MYKSYVFTILIQYRLIINIFKSWSHNICMDFPRT